MQNEWRANSLVWEWVKSINVLVWVWAISMGVGAEPRLPRALFCREGSFPRCQQSSVLVVRREGEREPAQAQAPPRPRERIPWWGSVHQAPREWCEVWCLLCHGKTAVYEGRAPFGPRAACCDLRGLLFPPFFKSSHMCRRANTDMDTIN